VLTYDQTVEWMFRQLPMYQKIGAVAFKKDLTNILHFSRELGDPHKTFKTIHVAGTNGKGSVSHMLASILQEAGYKVGLHTSPHLKDYRERIKINGKEIPENFVIKFIEENKEFLEANKLSFFEMSVAMAFDYFSQERVDIAIIEVGMGGRLDSTNIITPLLSVITNIGLDHTQFLGETLEEIAAEKAGIIKPGIPVVIGENQEETRDVFLKIAAEKNSEIIFAEDINVDNFKSELIGPYQVKNIRTAVAAIKVFAERTSFEISGNNIAEGLRKVKANTGLRGRWEILRKNPKVICDTAHNAEGLKYTMTQLGKEIKEKLHMVIGVVSDKDLSKILPLLPVKAEYYFCKPDVPRGMDENILKQEAAQYNLAGEAFSSVNEAYKAALQNAGTQDIIYVGGSTFTVAEVI